MGDSNDDQARLAAFKDARQVLRANYGQRGERKPLLPYLSAPTLSRLLMPDDKHPSEDFEQSIQTRLIHLLALPTSRSLYGQMARQMDQGSGEKTTILSHYLGEYRYFQYATKGGIGDLVYVSGEILIFQNRAGDPAFHHWSHDYFEKKPEHEGFVFHYESRLYFAATKQGVMRLGIARTFAGKRHESYLPGLIVSVRDDPHRDPYAARFIMVHSDNRELIAELDPASPAGAEAFKARTKADYAWYMLLH